jgi:hypothetical protein
MLIELGRTMLTSSDLPEFLWEYAVAHAAYLRNRAYTKHLKKMTPYQGWFNVKPNVSHLREFGAPVWVLLQGQKEQRKMLPKSKHRVYVGFDEGTKAVKYYNAETRKVLTSRNYRHLNTETNCQPMDNIEIPVAPREGETVTDTPGVTGSDQNLEPTKRKRNVEVEEEVDIDELQRMRGIRADYKHLHDPFPDEEDDKNEIFLTMEEVYAIIAGDELTSLKEAKDSPEWPEWERAMQEELDMLKGMGTWETVQKPSDAVPISNKWVFIRKRNNLGEVVHYKARLVVKGCAQCPGHDYMETFSPVVRMDTIRVILTLVPSKKLKLQQMDVKGAYLNGILQETIYMKQPEGFEDRTG